MILLVSYLQALRDVHHYGAGVKETSFYPCLVNLLNGVGATLKPKVQCVSILANAGAGNPDGGLFDKTQIQKGEAEPRPGQMPSRGAVEVKSTKDDAWVTADSDQVTRYWGRYRQVLVTNYRDFVLVGMDKQGQPVKLESYRLAEDETVFWHSPLADLVKANRARFEEFLKRVLLAPVALAEPKDVAWFLASYARDARARVEAADPIGHYPLPPASLPPVAALREALEDALGMRFTGEKGSHFYHSTLVQTLFYGIFSAWVLWHKEKPDRKDRFSWKEAEWTLHVPMIRSLFEQIATPSTAGALGLVEVLNWTEEVLNRVDRTAFFAKFQEAEAVQYFYEPFLEAFDPELRKALGVWYTPPQIVKYMVARVDAVLKSELDIPDGLADERVVVLDPCCGTGAYLVEVLRRIEAALREKEGAALAACGVKKAATSRVFGFEILPAPFVVSHLQLGLYLQGLGAPLKDEGGERAGVYLTNALTGWEPPKTPKTHLPFPGLEEERDAAERVKREAPILVILGNPPYNGFAGVAVEEERDLSTAYRKTVKVKAPQGQGLNDLYVRFFRMAERRIVEQSEKGVVCFISNYSWLDGLSFTGMREKYLDGFSHIWVDNLHGDRIISEYAPDGRTSETVFAMQGSSVGIKVGTAIALLSVNGINLSADAKILYRDVDQARAGERRAALFKTLDLPNIKEQYRPIKPIPELGLPFKPSRVSTGYLSWPVLPDLIPVSFPGVKTSRDDFLVAMNQEELMDRLTLYFDPCISHEEIRRKFPSAMASTARFQPEKVRDYLRARGFLKENMIRYSYRPFDVRWLYWEPETKLLDEKRSEYFPHVFERNVHLVSQQKPRRNWSLPQVIRSMGCIDLMDRSATVFPLYLRATQKNRIQDINQPSFSYESTESGIGSADSTGILASPRMPKHAVNISERADSFLKEHGCKPEDLFFHALAILHASSYREENAGALRQDWPRIPLPSSKDHLTESAALGRQVAALLDTEHEVTGVTAGSTHPELKPIGILSAVPGEAVDLAVTAGWGHGGKGDATMPGRGRTEARAFTEHEKTALGSSAQSLGPATLDIYLNPTTFFANVPEIVWDYTLGGYQVLKKWLSYREHSILGRPLKDDEARHFMNTARRIAALILLQAALDENYRKTISSRAMWPPNKDQVDSRQRIS